jgi:hypothetical protein
MPFLTAAPYILQGMSALGGIFGHKKKYIDPEMMRQKYGAPAITRDAQQYYNTILNSPYGRQLMASAATSGQGMQTDLNARVAGTGQGPAGGSDSGASDFASASGPQLQGSLESGARSNVWSQALPLAVQQNQNLASLEYANNAERNATPNTWQRIGAAAGGAAAMFPGQAPRARAALPTDAANGMDSAWSMLGKVRQ